MSGRVFRIGRYVNGLKVVNQAWDFAIRDMDGAQYEYYGLSFKDCDVNGATLVLDSDGNATLN